MSDGEDEIEIEMIKGDQPSKSGLKLRAPKRAPKPFSLWQYDLLTYASAPIAQALDKHVTRAMELGYDPVGNYPLTEEESKSFAATRVIPFTPSPDLIFDHKRTIASIWRAVFYLKTREIVALEDRAAPGYERVSGLSQGIDGFREAMETASTDRWKRLNPPNIKIPELEFCDDPEAVVIRLAIAYLAFHEGFNNAVLAKCRDRFNRCVADHGIAFVRQIAKALPAF